MFQDGVALSEVITSIVPTHWFPPPHPFMTKQPQVDKSLNFHQISVIKHGCRYLYTVSIFIVIVWLIGLIRPSIWHKKYWTHSKTTIYHEWLESMCNLWKVQCAELLYSKCTECQWIQKLQVTELVCNFTTCKVIAWQNVVFGAKCSS